VKEYVLFRGCSTPVRLPTYELATNLVLEKFGINVEPLKNANCCGALYVEALDEKAFLALNGRILAMAAQKGKDVLAICGACAGSLKHAKKLLDRRKTARAEINTLLAEEGLEYTKKVKVKHLLDIFQEDIGLYKLRMAITNPYQGVKLAAHYGCHATRSFENLHTGSDDDLTIIDSVIRVAGGIPVDYPGKMDCCGAPLSAMNEKLAGKVGMDKVRNVKESGAEGIVTACAYCDIQLTQVQFGGRWEKSRIPVLTLPQFLGPALGIDDDDLGLHLNRISPSRILGSLAGVR
jgi:heterodisulfide reductase subunit B